MAELTEDWKPQPLGRSDDVRSALSKAAPDIDWSDPAWGILDRDGFSMEINIGADDPCTSLMLHVRGGRDALPVVDAFSAKQGWYAIDTTMGEWLHHLVDAGEGQEKFNDFLNKVKQENGPKGIFSKIRSIFGR